jgi:hypothetical protein
MGIPSRAAAVAVVLAVVMTALCFATESRTGALQPNPDSGQYDLQGVQAAHTLRGQAWATELFGRRYGRNLLA